MGGDFEAAAAIAGAFGQAGKGCEGNLRRRHEAVQPLPRYQVDHERRTGFDRERDADALLRVAHGGQLAQCAGAERAIQAEERGLAAELQPGSAGGNAEEAVAPVPIAEHLGQVAVAWCPEFRIPLAQPHADADARLPVPVAHDAGDARRCRQPQIGNENGGPRAHFCQGFTARRAPLVHHRDAERGLVRCQTAD